LFSWEITGFTGLKNRNQYLFHCALFGKMYRILKKEVETLQDKLRTWFIAALTNAMLNYAYTSG